MLFPLRTGSLVCFAAPDFTQVQRHGGSESCADAAVVPASCFAGHKRNEGGGLRKISVYDVNDNLLSCCFVYICYICLLDAVFPFYMLFVYYTIPQVKLY